MSCFSLQVPICSAAHNLPFPDKRFPITRSLFFFIKRSVKA
ncbi:hypothetical protein D349_01250 [Enterococcus faecalis UP2S-6]|nr:hypothetical protein D349_01250 [Enterococcus faecalis UP2S-6]